MLKHSGTIYQCKEYHRTYMTIMFESRHIPFCCYISSVLRFSDERRCNIMKNVVGEAGVTGEISKKYRHAHKLSLMNGQISFEWIKSGIFSSKRWTLFGQ